MALNVTNLEHIDGKKVQHSTVTSQYPEIFVKRKRNTGELIVTTDTDQQYGMHHIYLGGEHIASGYGFAMSQTRNDLCYIQETYNAVFNYFNDAYTYHSSAYTWLNNFAVNAYTYTLQSLNDNSYYNVSVDNTNNKLTTNNTTYVFTFNNGILNIQQNNESIITIDEEEIVLINNTIIKDNVKDFVMYQLDINISDGMGVYDTLNTEHIQSINLIGVSENQDIYNTKVFDNSLTLESVKTNIINELKYTNTISIPLLNNIDTLFYIDYLDIHNNLVSTNKVMFRWITPIYIFTLPGTTEVTNDILDNIISDNHYLYKFEDKQLSAVINKSQILNNDYLIVNNNYQFYYIYVCLPVQFVEPIFYLSTNIECKENNAGGMIEIENINNNYKIYRSDKQYTVKDIRIDIEYNYNNI